MTSCRPFLLVCLPCSSSQQTLIITVNPRQPGCSISSRASLAQFSTHFNNAVCSFQFQSAARRLQCFQAQRDQRPFTTSMILRTSLGSQFISDETAFAYPWGWLCRKWKGRERVPTCTGTCVAPWASHPCLQYFRHAAVLTQSLLTAPWGHREHMR